MNIICHRIFKGARIKKQIEDVFELLLILSANDDSELEIIQGTLQ